MMGVVKVEVRDSGRHQSLLKGLGSELIKDPCDQMSLSSYTKMTKRKVLGHGAFMSLCDDSC